MKFVIPTLIYRSLINDKYLLYFILNLNDYGKIYRIQLNFMFSSISVIKICNLILLILAEYYLISTLRANKALRLGYYQFSFQQKIGFSAVCSYYSKHNLFNSQNNYLQFINTLTFLLFI